MQRHNNHAHHIIKTTTVNSDGPFFAECPPAMVTGDVTKATPHRINQIRRTNGQWSSSSWLRRKMFYFYLLIVPLLLPFFDQIIYAWLIAFFNSIFLSLSLCCGIKKMLSLAKPLEHDPTDRPVHSGNSDDKKK